MTVLSTALLIATLGLGVQPPVAQAPDCAAGHTAAGFKAQISVAICLDRAWQWDHVEPAIAEATRLLDSTIEGAPRPAARAFRLAGVDVPMPRRRRDAPANYPDDALAAGVSGFVIVNITIDPKGNVREATVARSVPLLDKAAMAAARKWKYEPTMVDGAAVEVRAYAAVRFGQTLEPVPADWLEFASFYYEQGLHQLTRSALIAALTKAREDRERLGGYLDGRKGSPEGVTMPVVTRNVPPRYPSRALAAHLDGIVVLEAIVDTRGEVGRARVVSKPSLLDAGAVNTIMLWKLTPASKGGTPVAMSIRAEVEFRLR